MSNHFTQLSSWYGFIVHIKILILLCQYRLYSIKWVKLGQNMYPGLYAYRTIKMLLVVIKPIITVLTMAPQLTSSCSFFEMPWDNTAFFYLLIKSKGLQSSLGSLYKQSYFWCLPCKWQKNSKKITSKYWLHRTSLISVKITLFLPTKRKTSLQLVLQMLYFPSMEKYTHIYTLYTFLYITSAVQRSDRCPAWL